MHIYFFYTQGVLRVRKRVTLMVITVTALFAACWLTDTIAHVSISYNDHKVAFTVIHTMILVNSSINPFVYALINQNFRDKIKGVLCCTCSTSARDLAALDPQSIESANKILPSSTKESSVDEWSWHHWVIKKDWVLSIVTTGNPLYDGHSLDRPQLSVFS